MLEPLCTNPAGKWHKNLWIMATNQELSLSQDSPSPPGRDLTAPEALALPLWPHTTSLIQLLHGQSFECLPTALKFPRRLLSSSINTSAGSTALT